MLAVKKGAKKQNRIGFYYYLDVVVGVDFVWDLNSGLFKFSNEPPVVLRPVDGGYIEDSAPDAALVVVAVGLATETEVEALKRGSLKNESKIVFKNCQNWKKAT
jgi:hypothetical protein